ncbi:MAG: hypothetical protein ACRBB0_25575 [Pelagimonas sp.]|uniref:hypothetical protein n=1 Tax=Pelagimonas sp. TaxID=2073170 RepID=UPI003D6A620E
MGRKHYFISLKRLKTHEVHTTIRLLNNSGFSWTETSKIFSDIQSGAFKSFGVFAGQLLLAYIVGSSLRRGNSVGVSFQGIEAAVPTSFFFATSSFFFLITCLAINHLSVALTLKSSLASRMLLHGFSINAYDAIDDKSGVTLGIPILSNSSFRESLPIGRFLSILVLICTLVMLIPVFAIGCYFLLEQLHLFEDRALSLFERLSAGAGVLIVLTGFACFLFFHIPIPFKKDTRYIRWNFLYKLEPHPSDELKFKRWLGETVKTTKPGSST